MAKTGSSGGGLGSSDQYGLFLASLARYLPFAGLFLRPNKTEIFVS